jgi:adenylate cyclase
VGDAVLGIFPLGEDAPGACRRALDAFADLQRNLDALNQRRAADGRRALSCGVGLHVGDVMYGNIGARSRLDFTVIGAPVNAATRVESATRLLHVPLLFTREFVDAAGLHDAVPLGAHAFKGIAERKELFTLKNRS